MILNFLVITLMAFAFGVERQLSNKPIGFGTFIFVSVGSCTLGVLASVISPDSTLGIIGGVVSGIGFLGAGALIRTTDKIFGFTTAASIWIFSIIGLTIGLGQFAIGATTYSVVWSVILVDKIFEAKGVGSYKRKVTLQTKKLIDKNEAISAFGKNKWHLISFEVNKSEKRSTLVYLVNLPRSYVNELKEKLQEKTWVESFKIE
jgi:putative Mg2+ transporter-C (MgtC) family protein